jgi:hypothetical protein
MGCFQIDIWEFPKQVFLFWLIKLEQYSTFEQL